MVEPVKMGPFLGINNRLPSEKLASPDGKGTFVRDAVNVDLTEAGTFQRRGGYTSVAPATRGRCLWGHGGFGYYVDGEQIKRFDGTDTVAVGNITAFGADVSFTDSPLGVLWSDGAAIMRIAGTTSAPVAPAMPNPRPVASGALGGALPAGIYRVAYASIVDGVRSALTDPQTITVPENGTIAIDASACPTQVVPFVSAPNGSVATMHAPIAPGGTASISVLNTNGNSVDLSRVEAPLLGGTILRYFRGRLFSVLGNVVSFSKPYQYGVHEPVRDFVALSSTITLFEPTQEGIFIATADETFFWAGTDITKASLKPIAPYGAIAGTVAYEPNTLNMWWQTPRGFVRTKDDNTLELRQDANMAFGTSASGASMFREQNGLVQVVSTLFGSKGTNAASAFSYMDAEIIK